MRFDYRAARVVSLICTIVSLVCALWSGSMPLLTLVAVVASMNLLIILSDLVREHSGPPADLLVEFNRPLSDEERAEILKHVDVKVRSDE